MTAAARTIRYVMARMMTGECYRRFLLHIIIQIPSPFCPIFLLRFDFIASLNFISYARLVLPLLHFLVDPRFRLAVTDPSISPFQVNDRSFQSLLFPGSHFKASKQKYFRSVVPFSPMSCIHASIDSLSFCSLSLLPCQTKYP